MVSKEFNNTNFMTSAVLNMILFKVLDIQDDEIIQRKIKRQKTDINGRRKIFIKFIILLCLILFYILQMKMKYIIIQIFIRKNKMNWKFLMVSSFKLYNVFKKIIFNFLFISLLDGF